MPAERLLLALLPGWLSCWTDLEIARRCRAFARLGLLACAAACTEEITRRRRS